MLPCNKILISSYYTLLEEYFSFFIYLIWINLLFSHFLSPFFLSVSVFYLFIYLFFKFYFIFKLYSIVLVLPNIEMNRHRYTCAPHPEASSLLPPHTIPLGHPSAPAPSIQYRASNLDWRLVSYIILYMFQCHSPKSPHPLPLPQSP